MINPSTLPYRPCVGIVLLNEDGKIWIGRRFQNFVERETTYRWQMPQGGIDDGEDPRTAVFRELYEETGIKKAKILRESQEWHVYDLPREVVGMALKGRYRGQRQKWFAMRFKGTDGDVNLAVDGHKAEFDEWRWANRHDILKSIVAFKRDVYESVLSEFDDLIG